MNQKGSRRQFIKGVLGGLGGIIAARLGGFFPEVRPLLAKRIEADRVPSPILPSQLDVGELYAGFLLLQEGIPLPDFIVCPEAGPPIICGVGQEKPELTGQGILYPTLEEVINGVDFPVYTLAYLPSELRLRGGSVIRYTTGEIYSASIDFEVFNPKVDLWETRVSIWAQPDFCTPYPLWFSSPAEAGEPSIVLEKVNFLPVPGIKAKVQQGAVYYWIENNTLFTLIQELDDFSFGVQEIIGSLEFIS